MLKNGQIYFKSLAVFTLQDFEVCLAIFQHYEWKAEIPQAGSLLDEGQLITEDIDHRSFRWWTLMKF